MHAKRIKLWLIFLLSLLLANTVNAAAEDLDLLNQTTDTETSMVWPLLPNESLAQLAAKFYPNNQYMQRQFISKTKRLNKTKLSASTRYKKLTAITIPNLKALSVRAGLIKRATIKPNEKPLRISHNIEPEKEKSEFSLSSIPERLIRQYEALLVRNEFLKEELAKLNKRLAFLENKLGELKLVLDRTLTLPSKKKLNNLDMKNAVENKAQTQLDDQAEVLPTAKRAAEKPTVKKRISAENKTLQKSFFDLSNKFIWLGLLLLALLVVLGSSLIGKYRERKYTKLVSAISQQTPEESFSKEGTETTPKEESLLQSTADTDSGTAVEEQTDITVLQEAKALVAQGEVEEAISHLKWAIRAKPKVSINTWLYLLSMLRQQNLKEDFETFATEIHQHFNIMTPLWTPREVEMIVPQTLEEFPHIVKFLTKKWPNEKLIIYLKKLIYDTRLGERSGFSLPVVQEILLLIDVLEMRGEVEKI